MIIGEEYLKEFTLDVYAGEDGSPFAEHVKCKARSPHDLNAFGMYEWIHKHRYECPEVLVSSITAGLEDGRHNVVYATTDGRTVVETWKDGSIEKSVSRRLIPQ